MATGAAKAETDVTFGGKYDLLTGTGDVQPGAGVVTTAPADLTYNYDVPDGSSISGVNADVVPVALVVATSIPDSIACAMSPSWMHGVLRLLLIILDPSPSLTLDKLASPGIMIC